MRTFFRKTKKVLSLMMAVLLVWTMIPASAMSVWAEGGSGSFVLMALSNGQSVIPPVTVSYQAGATVKEALLASGYSFTGLEEDNWISAVEGIADSYALYYDNGGYDLTVGADQISAIWITGNYDQGYSDALLTLEKDLAEYREAQDGRQQYAPLAEAAAAALSGFWSADAETALVLDAELSTQTENYMEIIHGDTAPVVLNITQGGNKLVPAVCTFTNEYGVQTVFENPAKSRISLVPGNYTFDISDGGWNHVRGSVTVSAGVENTLTAALPSGQWITDAEIGITNSWTESVSKTGSLGNNAVYYVPDYAGTSLYIYAANAEDVDPETVDLYFGTDGTVGTGRKNWNSHNASVSGAIEKDSLNPATLTIEAVTTGGDGYQQAQSYTVSVVRVPTLADLTVSSEGTVLPLSYDPATEEYSLSVVSASVDVTGTLLCENAQLSVNGAAASSGVPVSVNLQENAVTDVTVTAASENAQRSYLLHIERKASAKVVVKHASGMETIVKNAAGAEIQPVSKTASADTYHLTPGETYTWVGTKNTYYHTSGSFTAAAGKTITAATPVTTDWMTGLEAKSTTAASAVIYEVVPAFSAAQHELDIRVGSFKTLFYMKADLAGSDYSLHASYRNYQGIQTEKDVTAGKFGIVAGIVSQSGRGTEMLLTVTKNSSDDSVIYYQEYRVNVRRLMELNTMSTSDSKGNAIVLTQDNGSGSRSFDTAVLEYRASVQKSLQELVVSEKLYTSLSGNDSEAVITVSSPGGSAVISYDEEHAPNTLQSVSVPLDPNADEEDVSVTVSHPDSLAVAQTYLIHVAKLDPVLTTIAVTPGSATVFLTDDLSGSRIYPEEDGRYSLCDSLSYSYNITAKGYVGITGSFTASKSVTRKSFTLQKAQETDYTDISGEDDWSSFRQDGSNNGVTSAATPISSDDSVLVWANKIGDGYGSGATGCPILVGGYLYTYAGTSIVKVDKNTGEVVQSGSMAGSSSFAINAPTYANGMIFVGLSNGRIQAFNAETLESLWVYTDPLGGQPNSSITYKDGYVYTGFWVGETKNANFVCLSVTDEDPSNPTEAKLATWRYTDTGFYWAGAYATDGYVLVTTDDGQSGSTSGYGSVVSLDPATGQVLDFVKMPCTGDLRSSICYDAATDACYFTSKGGYFCSIRVNADGTFKDNSLRILQLENGTGSNAMSTSTPTVYNGRAYVGVSGSGQFTPYSGHNITVIDLASWTIAYTVPTQGYPQTSGLLTTAYEGAEEYVYVYFLDNYTPGKLRVLRDKAGQTALDPNYKTVETYTVKGVEYEVETAYVLFTPSGQQAQYAICSPIVDAEGNIYFKNDSAQLMKLSSTISSLEIVNAPGRTEYCKGELFDASGLQVTAHYSNGQAKDISRYVSFYLDTEWEKDAETQTLSGSDQKVFIKYDLDKMLQGDTSHWTLYHNEGGEAGIVVSGIPYAEAAIKVYEDHTDADNDGFCDRCKEICTEIPLISKQPENVTAAVKDVVSFQVSCVGAVSYQWQYSKNGGSSWVNSGATGAATNKIRFTVSSTNMNYSYRCELTGKSGEKVYTDVVKIQPYPDVKILTQPSVRAAALKEAITFTVSAENAAAYQWQYSKDKSTWKNSSVTSATTASLKLTASETSAAYYYRCKITGINGKDTYTKTVGYVLITEQPQSVQSLIGDTVVYKTAGKNIASYQWYYSKDQGSTWSKSSVAEAVTDSISVKVSSGNAGRLYRCQLTDSRGFKVYTNTVEIMLIPGAKILTQPENQGVTIGKTFKFTVSAENAETYQWQYSKDKSTWKNSNAATATTSSIKITASTTSTAYYYRCKITGLDGKSIYTKTVGSVVITKQPETVKSSIGQSLVLQVEAQNIASYQWYYSKDNGKTWAKSSVSTAVTDKISIKVSTSTIGNMYRCRLTDSRGIVVYSNAAKVTT